MEKNAITAIITIVRGRTGTIFSVFVIALYAIPWVLKGDISSLMWRMTMMMTTKAKKTEKTTMTKTFMTKTTTTKTEFLLHRTIFISRINLYFSGLLEIL